jgi:hypothetical protein
MYEEKELLLKNERYPLMKIAVLYSVAFVLQRPLYNYH